MTNPKRRQRPRTPLPTPVSHKAVLLETVKGETSRSPLGRQRAGENWHLKPVMMVSGVAFIALVAWVALSLWSGNTDRGAAPVPVVAQLKSPDTHSLLIDPSDPDHILFGSHAGIQESEDGGITWHDGTLTGVDAMSMSVSSMDPSTIYVTGHDVFLVSRNGGKSWQPLAHDLPGTDIHAFTQDPLDPARLYAFVVGAGIFTSLDGGSRWTKLPAQPSDGAPLSLSTNGIDLYAGMGTGLMVSHDKGANWGPSPEVVPGVPITVVAPAMNPQLIYVGTQIGLAASSDGGQTWTWVGETNKPVLALAAAPSDSRRVVMISEGGGVSRSDDGGKTWRSPN